MNLNLKLLFLLNSLAGKSKLFDWLIIFLASYLPYCLIIILFLLLYFSSYLRKKKIEILWITLLSAFIGRFGVTTIIRSLYHHPRPFILYSVHPLFIDNSWSFPSGHATFFFALAAALYWYNKKWGIAFLIAAALMTISRVIAGVHYPFDIAAGMVIGVGVAYLVIFVSRKWFGISKYG